MNLLIRAWILPTKLVTREAYQLKVLAVLGIALDFFVEFLEAFELGREAAFGGGVEDESYAAFLLFERVGLAFFCVRGRDVVSM